MRDGSTDSTSRSRTTRDSSRQTDAQVVAHLDRAAGERERRRRVLVGDRLQRIEQQIAADQAEHRRHVVRARSSCR